MAEPSTAAAPAPETEGADAPEMSRDAKPWLKMIDKASRKLDYWQDKCDGVEKQFASLKRLANDASGDREFQMFYANMEVLKPSIYARKPVPVVTTRFNDRKPVARKAAEMLERVVISNFDRDRGHEALKLARNDMAMIARGVIWARLEDYEDADGVKECVCWDWVHRRDFLHDMARCWREVGWVARRSYLTAKQGKKRFAKAWKKIEYEGANEDGSPEDAYNVENKAAVWEIWSKELGLVIWVHPKSDEVLDIAAPHVQLEGFFPCPPPAFGAVEPGTLVPVPDFLFYSDQLAEINELTSRISALSESLRMKGFYPQGVEDVGDAIEKAIKDLDNRALLIGVPGYAALGGAATLRDSIVWLPVGEIATTVSGLVALRKQLIDDVYQISGISDIMRGQTAASETLGAQQLKSQYGSIRIRDRQEEMARIANDGLIITGEMIAEQFSLASMIAMSAMDDLPTEQQVAEQATQELQAARAQLVEQALKAAKAQQPPQPEPQPEPGPEGAPQPTPPMAGPMPVDMMAISQAIAPQLAQLQAAGQKKVAETVTQEKVHALLRSQKLRPFVLQVSTESTIQPDEQAEKAARSEFTQALGLALGQLGQLVAAQPEAAPFAGQLLKFTLAPFRAGREMEGAIDDFVEQMKTKMSEPKQAPPSPDQIKAEMVKAEGEREAQRFQREAEVKVAEFAAKKDLAAFNAGVRQAEAAARMAEIERKAQSDAARMAHDEVMAGYAERLALINLAIAEKKLGAADQIGDAADTGEQEYEMDGLDA